ncbi:MAG: Glycosyl transferase family 2 [Microgenomates group bacterium GW2011_GWC1_41_8]|uniref:Glycosyl transferase family 2 n=2 Tax=Candidatus Roizmaniibacteriota TaxID=1752723 RepID=A0A0G0TAX2_9BACT|nr:MAG: Glycosyl transferase family 2 [Candidatus Roizmanbacteria bacterium GW2011_GWB1_40_7]KKR94720.1 MAG: Glycosyl transferase family 2 [Candidatus Roizmanbacteria bacterium GW2011_GWA1_41_13]KKS24703.1 MAG: Glycosyl transferase family 2 [Microgenomates group bacterium GW2011_GWC1_41_8]OGK50033.1 MAG: hypothetical protein A3A55_03670 [Candidatus Roizmanbacteria bacterium RIFCSPLOWO2_01_FULL_40_14]
MKKIRSLSIFFPAYNDAYTLPYLISRVIDVASEVADTFEILIINDGSTDNTIEIVKELQKQYACLNLISHRKNKGYGGALISGFKQARYEWIFYTDGDGQYDPNELLQLVGEVNIDVDVVNGYKIKRSDSLARKILGGIYNFTLHKIFEISISDIDCDFRLIRRKSLKKVRLTSTSGFICLQLVLGLQKTGARFREVGVHHYPRPVGSSQFFQPKHILKTLKEFLEFYRNKNE